MKINVYLNFNGNCAEAFKFYADVFGGTIEMMQTFGESPMAGQASPEWKDAIMHARMSVGDNVLMASDALEDHFKRPQGFFISLQIDTPEEADRIYNALAEGASIEMALQETFWAARFGMLTDRFGTPWMINCDKAA